MIFVGYQGIGKSTLAMSNKPEGCHVATISREWFKVGGQFIPNHFDIIDNIAKLLYTQHISTALMCDPMYYEINVNRNTFDGPVYLDLDSSVFYIDGERDPRWYVVYAKIAIELSMQGFYVFISTHTAVRNQIRDLSYSKEYFELERKVKIYSIYPSLELGTEWVDKLHTRWLATGLEKDHRAFCYASAHYRASISDLMSYPVYSIVITDMNYNLSELINAHLNEDKSKSYNVIEEGGN